MRKGIGCIVAIIIVFASVGVLTNGYAQEGGVKMSESVYDQVYNETEVKDGIKEITYDQFMKIRNSGEDYALLDALSLQSYNEGHIENSFSFPVGEINEKSAATMLTKDSNIVVYCGSFRCSASTMAASKLHSLGYKVLDYKGGLKEWQEKEKKLVK